MYLVFEKTIHTADAPNDAAGKQQRQGICRNESETFAGFKAQQRSHARTTSEHQCLHQEAKDHGIDRTQPNFFFS